MLWQNIQKEPLRRLKKTMHNEGRKIENSTGKKVTLRKQAIAIGLSEAREEEEKVPKDFSESYGGKTKSASKKSEGKSSSKTKSKRAHQVEELQNQVLQNGD